MIKLDDELRHDFHCVILGAMDDFVATYCNSKMLGATDADLPVLIPMLDEQLEKIVFRLNNPRGL
ncbi:hypothetical protein [Polynucleobacter sp.]|uniref:hypothetical protein n=1 Tax=Polynucleobacter sp. TaxID=2029855 RepID=UPI003F69534E